MTYSQDFDLFEIDESYLTESRNLSSTIDEQVQRLLVHANDDKLLGRKPIRISDRLIDRLSSDQAYYHGLCHTKIKFKFNSPVINNKKTYSLDVVLAENFFSVVPATANKGFLIGDVEFVRFLEINHHFVLLQFFKIDIFLFQWAQKQIWLVLETFIVEWSEFLVVSSVLLQSSTRREKHNIMKYIEINFVCFTPLFYIFIPFLKTTSN